MLDSMVCH
ncbi:hypothetical protein RDI58_015524 [Solanum bulbocastanum]|uniref:Uncharacterized protein n=1 Tax=Solanum bulbocastanum TaxID=147425 RepID=A0AAN8YBN8_SOLBU